MLGGNDFVGGVCYKQNSSECCGLYSVFTASIRSTGLAEGIDVMKHSS